MDVELRGGRGAEEVEEDDGYHARRRTMDEACVGVAGCSWRRAETGERR